MPKQYEFRNIIFFYDKKYFSKLMFENGISFMKFFFGIMTGYLLITKYFTLLDEIDGIFKLRTNVLETLEIKLENVEKNNSDIVFLNSIGNKIQELSLFFFF